MRIAIRLLRLAIFVSIILVIGRGLSFPKYIQWILIIGAIWVELWDEIIARFVERVARQVFDTNVDWQWKPNGKWYAFSRGFVHLGKDGVNLGRDSCLLTLFFWALTLLINIVGILVVVTKLASWLSAIY